MMSYVIGPVGPKFSPAVSKEISKENCKQDFEFPAETKQSNNVIVETMLQAMERR